LHPTWIHGASRRTATTWNGSITVTASERGSGGVLVAAESVHGHHLDSPAEGLIALGEPAGQGGGGTAGNQIEQPGPAGTCNDGGEVDDDGDVAIAGGVVGVGPAVLVNADHPYPIEDQATQHVVRAPSGGRAPGLGEPVAVMTEHLPLAWPSQRSDTALINRGLARSPALQFRKSPLSRMASSVFATPAPSAPCTVRVPLAVAIEPGDRDQRGTVHAGLHLHPAWRAVRATERRPHVHRVVSSRHRAHVPAPSAPAANPVSISASLEASPIASNVTVPSVSFEIEIAAGPSPT